MMKLLAVLAIGAGLATPVYAASFTVAGGTNQAVPANNDFQSQLAGMGLTTEGLGSTLSLTGPATVEFTLYASEAVDINQFLISGTQPPGFITTGEPAKFYSVGSVDVTYGSGPITNLAFNLLSGPDPSITVNIGGGNTGNAHDFAIISNSLLIPPSAVTNVGGLVALAFDDGGAGPDDNHDDMIILARIVPEPATWMLMIAGFAALGFAQRRRMARV